MMAREVTYIKQDKPEGEILPAFLRYNFYINKKKDYFYNSMLYIDRHTCDRRGIRLCGGTWLEPVWRLAHRDPQL